MPAPPSRKLARVGLNILLAATLAVGFSLSSGSVRIAQAATYTVDTAADSDAAAFQACTLAANDCSLRGAIAKANSTAAFDSINVPAGFYVLSDGPLVISSSLSLEGASKDTTFIDGNFATKVMEVHGTDSPTVSISEVTIRNGRGGPSLSGGGLQVFEGAYVSLYRVNVTNNRTNAPGGGLANGGTLILSETYVYDNRVPIDGAGDVGGVQHSGGGIMNFSDATLRIIRSAVTDNYASRGGGIRNAGGHMEITNSTISGNFALTRGGGIMNFGTAWIAYSTITDNEIDGLVDNQFDPSGGGGIYNDVGEDLDGNVARVSIGNSIVAENQDNRGEFNALYSPDCFSVDPARFTSFRGNVVGIVNGNCNLADTIYGDDASFDQVGTDDFPLDPWLLPLAFNDGSTPNHAIQQVSPALDRGDGITSADFFDCPDEDQRGIPRPQGVDCDAGAYEIEQIHVPLGLDFTSNPTPPGVPRVIIAVPANPNFDPYRQIDLNTLAFGVTGRENSLVRLPNSRAPACEAIDYNRDGLYDLVCKFQLNLTGLECGENTAILRAARLDAEGLVVGTAALNIGPCQ